MLPFLRSGQEEFYHWSDLPAPVVFQPAYQSQERPYLPVVVFSTPKMLVQKTPAVRCIEQSSGPKPLLGEGIKDEFLEFVPDPEWQRRSESFLLSLANGTWQQISHSRAQQPLCLEPSRLDLR